MTPLAAEILADLETEEQFCAGASVATLRGWLGETEAAIRAALAELADAKLVYSQSRKFHSKARATLAETPSARFKGTIIKLSGDGVQPLDIADRLQISHRVVQGVLSRHRAEVRAASLGSIAA